MDGWMRGEEREGGREGGREGEGAFGGARLAILSLLALSLARSCQLPRSGREKPVEWDK